MSLGDVINNCGINDTQGKAKTMFIMRCSSRQKLRGDDDLTNFINNQALPVIGENKVQTEMNCRHAYKVFEMALGHRKFN